MTQTGPSTPPARRTKSGATSILASQPTQRLIYLQPSLSSSSTRVRITADLVPHARCNPRRVNRRFELLRTLCKAGKLLIEHSFCFVCRQAAHTLRDEIGDVVDVLHELRDFNREMFVVVHYYCR